MQRKNALALLLFLALISAAQAELFITNFATSLPIPDGNTSGVQDAQTLSGLPQETTEVKVTLNISGGYNGDLYASLTHSSGFVVLLNRVGKPVNGGFGYDDTGFSVTLSGTGSAPDVHLYQNFGPAFNGSGQLTGTWSPDGRQTAPQSVLDTDPRTALLSSFVGLDPNGTWTLLLSDWSAGEESILVSWGLEISAKANAAPVLTVPSDQAIDELSTLTVTNTATDSDVPANFLTFSLVSPPTGMGIHPTSGMITWTPTEAQGPSTNVVTVRVTDDGTPSLSDTKSFTVVVTEVNNVPVLTLPANTNINEQALYSANATATDGDAPAQTLNFALVSGPAGLTVSGAGAIAWTPTEAQGPSTNVVTIRVTDDGTPPLSDTNSYTLIVKEANSAPELTLPANTNINEQALYSATATATDVDAPAQTLTFALVSGPAGLTVSGAGAISWTPTEAQGPSTNVVTIRVTDSGTPPLSDTNSYTLIVKEANGAPVLTLPANTNINELALYSATATATDGDLPAQTLSFALVSGPAGLTVSGGGAISWTPTEAQGPSTNVVMIRVTDNGTPTMSTTNTYTLIVKEVNSAPVLTLPASTNINEQALYSANATATDGDLPAQTLSFALVSGPAGLTVSGAGAIAWTPTEAQGPSTNVVTIRVTDSGTPPLSDTNNYTLTVKEANGAPVLTLPANTNLNELALYGATATATDGDLPAQTLTFGLVSGPAGLTVSGGGAIGWTPTEAQGPSTNVVTIRVTDDGTPATSTTNSYTVIVKEVNSAPMLTTLPADTNINEQALYSATATATDGDVPAQTLSFALVNGPAGLTVSGAGAIAWTPTEAQGPSTNVVTIRVTDNGTPPLSDTNSYTLIVKEANGVPVLTLPANTNLNELAFYSATATATDSDVPAQSLSFARVSGPAGLTVSGAGAIAWTPTEAQGPSTNVVTIRVTDNGTPPTSTTNSYTVIVKEVNSAPVLTLPANTNINEQALYSANATATDGDAPAQTLSFALVSGPAGLTVSGTGAIAWTPTEAQGPGTNVVTIRVTDNGTPPLSDTNSYTLIVKEANGAPVLTLPANTNINELTFYSATATATDSDVPAQTLTFGLVSGPAGLTVSGAGAIAWTPTEAQGPSTNVVKIRVTDNGTPTMSATNSYTLIVNETNIAQVFILAQGRYNGLFYETNQVQQYSAGFLTASVTPRGTYSGYLQNGARRYRFSGNLDLECRATNRFSLYPLTNTVILEFQIGKGNQIDRLFGRVSDGVWFSALTGDRAVFNSRTAPAPYAGRYTIRIPGQGNDPSFPTGDGYGIVRVDANGRISLAGVLADGARVTQGVPLSRQGFWPLYVSLYAGKGSVLSWLAFPNQPTNDLNGWLNWIKPADVRARFYPGGFTNQSQVAGSLYVPPIGATNRVLNLTSGEVAFRGGNLGADFTNSITLGLYSRVGNSSSNRLSMNFSLATGMFRGGAIDPTTGRWLAYGGVVLQNHNAGFGFLLGTNLSSHVVLAP